MSKQETAFTDSVTEFVGNAPWLGPEHAPSVAALKAMARQLDEGPIQAALLGQFGLTYRALLKERPDEQTTDPLEDALAKAGAGEG